MWFQNPGSEKEHTYIIEPDIQQVELSFSQMNAPVNAGIIGHGLCNNLNKWIKNWNKIHNGH
jgi:hypothetical protein